MLSKRPLLSVPVVSNLSAGFKGLRRRLLFNQYVRDPVLSGSNTADASLLVRDESCPSRDAVQQSLKMYTP